MKARTFKDFTGLMTIDFAKDDLRKIMDKYGYELSPLFSGVNQDGEWQLIEVTHDTVTVSTAQGNGWERQNVYHRDGTTEETFPGRWR